MPWSVDLPRDVTRRERLMLFAILVVCDDETGEVIGREGRSAREELEHVLDIHDEDHMRETLKQLEERKFIRRARTRLFCALPRFLPGEKTRRCANCNKPRGRWARVHGRWCARCRQAFRDDRRWQIEAINLSVAGKTPPEIAAAVDRPLWRSSKENDNQASAVVPFLLAQRLIGDEWREAMNEVLARESRQYARPRAGRRR